MAHDPDPERLKSLEKEIKALKEKNVPKKAGPMAGASGGEAAWRMVMELVSGMGLGLAIGYGLDVLFGTKPILMIIFVLLGFIAGIKTMLRTAAELGKQAGSDPGNEKRD